MAVNDNNTLVPEAENTINDLRAKGLQQDDIEDAKEYNAVLHAAVVGRLIVDGKQEDGVMMSDERPENSWWFKNRCFRPGNARAPARII